MATEPAGEMTCTGSGPIGTKIVATLGPATNTVEAVGSLVQAGIDVARLNFSHGDRASHEKALANLRAAADAAGRPVAVMGDLCGPKIRLGKIAGGAVSIERGDRFRLVSETIEGGPGIACVNQPEILDDIRAGHRVLIDDGAILLRAEAATPNEVTCVCEFGGSIGEHKGINLPDTDLCLASLTDKDREDARWAVASGLDYLALSFVRSADDIGALRAMLTELGANIHIVAKVETPRAVANLDAIIAAADAILIARGDLGVELDVARVPRIQKNICDLCREAGKPAIVATQMLQSMIHAPSPTRAEVSDAANAIVDGADALMLSGETAVGQYAREAVRTLRRVAVETEAYDEDRLQPVRVNVRQAGVTAAVAHSMRLIADELQPQSLVVWTDKGGIARLLSKHRPNRPIVALAPTEKVRRRMSLYYGVTAFCADKPGDEAKQLAVADERLQACGFARPGDIIVAGFGPHSLERGDTGSISIHTVQAARLT